MQENPGEVRTTLTRLKEIGYKGVILVHAKKIVLEAGKNVAADEKYDDSVGGLEVETWKQSNLETLRLVEEGDFVAVKYGPCIACTSSFESAYQAHLSAFLERGHRLYSNLLKACNQPRELKMQSLGYAILLKENV